MNIHFLQGKVQKPKSRRPDSLRHKAYVAIKHQIITCELKPGEVLSEAILSDRLEIGRTPVRQAIDHLVIDGLIEVLPRKGIVVRPISLDEIVHVNEVRLINEAHSVRRAAERATDAEVALLQDNLARMQEATQNNAFEDLMLLDREFHALLSNGARNPILSELLRNLHERSLRLWFISLRANDQHMRVCEQHAAIIEAVRDRNPDAAEGVMRAHIESFMKNLTGQL